ncbi:MAG: response regulator transcription factor [Eubacteriales bacterium]|jgi:two-component system response regulator ResD
MKILIVDDEAVIRDIIREYIEFEQMEAVEASNGREALEALDREGDVDLVVLDIMMPEMDGYETLRRIRKKSDMPVIMLSAKGEVEDKLCGFDLGVDDYIPKPFSPKELITRIKTVLRRAAPKQQPARALLRLGGVTVDKEARTVQVDGRLVECTPKEFDLLVYLLENPGRALSRDQILNQVWGYEFYGEERTVDTHIKMLRSKLGPYKEHIKTVWGHGYKLEVEDHA